MPVLEGSAGINVYVKYMGAKVWHHATLYDQRDYDGRYYEYVRPNCNQIAKPVVWHPMHPYYAQYQLDEPSRTCAKCMA